MQQELDKIADFGKEDFIHLNLLKFISLEAVVT